MPLLPNGTFKLEGATEEPLKVGDKALDFSRTNQNGEKVSLSDLAGTPVAILLVSSATNDLTKERLTKFKRLSASLPGTTPIVLANDYFSRNKELAEAVGGIDFHILDDQSEGYEAIATYEQPTDTGTDYPLYLLSADHTITSIKSGDEFLAQSDEEVIASLTPVVRPTRPVRTAE